MDYLYNKNPYISNKINIFDSIIRYNNNNEFIDCFKENVGQILLNNLRYFNQYGIILGNYKNYIYINEELEKLNKKQKQNNGLLWNKIIYVSINCYVCNDETCGSIEDLINLLKYQPKENTIIFINMASVELSILDKIMSDYISFIYECYTSYNKDNILQMLLKFMNTKKINPYGSNIYITKTENLLKNY